MYIEPVQIVLLATRGYLTLHLRSKANLKFLKGHEIRPRGEKLDNSSVRSLIGARLAAPLHCTVWQAQNNFITNCSDQGHYYGVRFLSKCTTVGIKAYERSWTITSWARFLKGIFWFFIFCSDIRHVLLLYSCVDQALPGLCICIHQFVLVVVLVFVRVFVSVSVWFGAVRCGDACCLLRGMWRVVCGM